MTRSWARRSFDAATIFIALVICCVFFTARTRRRRSISDGMVNSRQGAKGRAHPLAAWTRLRCCSLPGREVARELLHRSVERRLQLIVELFLLDDLTEHLRMPGLEEGVQLAL